MPFELTLRHHCSRQIAGVCGVVGVAPGVREMDAVRLIAYRG